MALDIATPSLGGLPGLNLHLLMTLLLQYFLASIRIGAFLISAPLFGARWLPLQVRIIFAFSISLIVASQVPSFDPIIIGSFSGLIHIGTEIIVGLTAGLILTIWFSAVMLAGEKIAASAGLGFAAQIDPQTGGQTPVVSQTLYLFLTVIFVTVDGHLAALNILLQSYEALPIGSAMNFQVLIGAGIAAAGAMFVAATVMMLPIVMVLLMINLAIGVITKSAPQLNMFSFGFPISMIGVFILLYLSVGAIGDSMQQLIDDSLFFLADMFEGLVHG